jgi:hypothetical protein
MAVAMPSTRWSTNSLVLVAKTLTATKAVRRAIGIKLFTLVNLGFSNQECGTTVPKNFNP